MVIINKIKVLKVRKAGRLKSTGKIMYKSVRLEFVSSFCYLLEILLCGNTDLHRMKHVQAMSIKD